MEKHRADVLKKLSRRRKMFEDYISQAKKPEGVGMRREKWNVGRKETWDVRREKWDVKN